MVTLGHINYLNCLPVHGPILMGDIAFPGVIELGVPAELNGKLERGEIDIAPCSSVEIMRGHLVVPGLCIASVEDVQSVILVTRRPIEELHGGRILLTSHSATSVLLLEVILTEFYGVDADYERFDPSVTAANDAPADVSGMLYIGDSALLLGDTEFPHRYDLASLWFERTGLPFTFALWQVNRKSALMHDLRDAVKALRGSYALFLNDPARIARAFASETPLGPEAILAYWNRLSFILDDRHITSLQMFFGLAAKHGLVERVPEIEFYG